VQYKYRKIYTTVSILIVLSLILLSGCGLGSDDGGNGGNNSGNGNSGTQGSQSSDTEGQTQPPVQLIVEIPTILVPEASGMAVEENDQAIIDFSNKQDGYIMAKFLEVTDMKAKILITVPDGTVYQYTLRPDRGFEAFPLSGGNGSYEVGVFKQIEGTRYAMVLSTTLDVTLSNEFAPFLRPNQYVNFHQDCDVVRKAAELVAGRSTFMEKVGEIYHFVISNLTYDVELAETVQVDYLPEVDKVLERRKGICFDFASLMAAMLRSQGIPTKLMIGYTGDVYHAWISVFSEEDGWLDDVIQFNGHAWRLMDPTFAASGSTEAVAQYIGDGENYVVKFMH
jgi:hypothetical protein